MQPRHHGGQHRLPFAVGPCRQCFRSVVEAGAGADTAADGSNGRPPLPARWGSADNIQKVRDYIETLAQHYPYDAQFTRSVSAIALACAGVDTPSVPACRTGAGILQQCTCLSLLLKCKHAWSVRQKVVAGGRRGIAALVQQLQVARVDSHSLVRVAAEQVAVADVVGPCSAAVRFARKRCLVSHVSKTSNPEDFYARKNTHTLGPCLHSPFAIQAGRRERPEVTSIGANSLHDHQIL